MIKKLALAAFIALIGFAIYLYVYLGGFKEPRFMVLEQGPLHLVYVSHSGAYHEIGPKIESVEAWAHSRGYACDRTFGEYLDNPSAVDQDRLRSQGGCVMKESVRDALPEGMKYEERPARRYLVGTFEGSPAIGPFKVYPKAYETMESQRLKSDGPTIEIYTVHGTSVTTQYLFPVAPPPAP